MYRLPNNNGTACILSHNAVPSFDPSYEWVSDFVKSERLRDEIKPLQDKRSEIEGLPISNSEKIARLKIGYDLFQKKITAHVQSFLLDAALWHNGVCDPFTNFEIRFWPRDKNFFLPPFSMFEEAIKQQRDDGISDPDRIKRIQAIDAKINDLQNKIPPTITREHKAFVEFWHEVQGQLSEPSGPRALSLDASSDQEKNAWEALGLSDFQNPLGLKPNPAD